MSDSDPHHIRASNFVRQWNQDIADAAARQRQYEAYNGGSRWRGVGSADGPRLSAWVFAAGILGFAVGMLLGDGEFLPMIGYGLLAGAVCAGIAIALQDSVGDAALRVAVIGAGIGLFFGMLSMLRRK